METLISGGAAMAASSSAPARLRGVTLTAEVVDVLRRSTVEGDQVRLPFGQLDRPLYLTVDKALKALGGKWDRRAGAHVFPRPIEDELAAALGTGLIVDRKKTLEQFFTPSALAERLCELADVGSGDHVLEPSAGSGNLVNAALARGAMVTAVEIDELLCRDLMAVGHHGDVFTFRADFLTWRPASALSIDKVLMNPPFSAGKDVAHVRHAWELLGADGTLAAIMGEHAFFADDRASIAFRDFLQEIGATVERIEAGAFKESGTMVGTRIVVAHKR